MARSLGLASFRLALVSLLALTTPWVSPPTAGADGARIVVEIGSLRSDGGHVRGALFAGRGGWAEEGHEIATCRAAIHGQKSWNGVAILARSEPRVTQVGLPGFAPAGARLLSAEVDGLSFTSIYVPNGKSIDHADFPGKLAWLDGLIGRKTWVCGDRFTLCDIVLYCALDFGAGVGQELDSGLLNLNAWFARMLTRPSAHASLHPDGHAGGRRGV